jgi:hypothetical protein
MKSAIKVAIVVGFLFMLNTEGAVAAGPGQGGRRIRLDNAPAGPYRLRVITSPTPPLVEQLYLEVRVTDADKGEPILNAYVMTVATPIDGSGQAVEAEATHEFAPISSDYAAHLKVNEVGQWEVEVLVQGDLGEGSASFTERVTSRNTIGPLLSVAVPIAALLALGLIFFWLQRNG